MNKHVKIFLALISTILEIMFLLIGLTIFYCIFNGLIHYEETLKFSFKPDGSQYSDFELIFGFLFVGFFGIVFLYSGIRLLIFKINLIKKDL